MTRHLLLILILCLPIPLHAATSMRNAPTPTVDSAIDAARSHSGQIGSSGAISGKLFGPATSDSAKFSTFDGKKEFSGAIMCGGQAPVMELTAFPVGSLSGIGELNIRVRIDTNMDGTMDLVKTINNVGGMCSNGYVRDCNPSGSWKDCKFCQWVLDGNELKEKCEFARPGYSTAYGMKGCFCFNASCGAPAASIIESILSNAGNGILNLLTAQNNLVAVTGTEYLASELKLNFMGSKVANCSDIGQGDKKIAKLRGLYGQFDFPAQDALSAAEADRNHPYNAVASTFGNEQFQTLSCTQEASVTREFSYVDRPAPMRFGVGINRDNGTCYQYSDSGCSAALSKKASLADCAAHIAGNRLDYLCGNFTRSGVFNTMSGISDVVAASGVGRYSSCSGAGNVEEQEWQANCWGGKQDDVFHCHSPSMGLEGEAIKNDPFRPALYQGCDTVRGARDNCATMESRRARGECELKDEIIDGVYSLKDGASTELTAGRQCRAFTGKNRNLTVCEPFWKKERVYKCRIKNLDLNFDKVKERSNYIGGNIGFDFSSSTWRAQPDVVWNTDGEKVHTVYDSNIQFQQTADSCMPACRVATRGVLTDSANPLKAPEIIKTCAKQKSGSWNCPLEAGETAVTGCQCLDMNAFIQGISAMQVIGKASQDMICSSGDNVGICEPSEEEKKPRVVCYTGLGDINDPTSLDKGGIKDCTPKLWQGTGIANQNHEVKATSGYHCFARVPSYPEDDHFHNDLGPLTPISAWFDPVDAWARPLIADLLARDPAFIPDPGPQCPCDRNGPKTSADGVTTTCSWTSQLSVANVNRRDILGLAPESSEPFGRIEYAFSAGGIWGGSNTAACVRAEPPYVEISPMQGSCDRVDVPIQGSCSGQGESICSSSCNLNNKWSYSCKYGELPCNCTRDGHAHGSISIYGASSFYERRPQGINDAGSVGYYRADSRCEGIYTPWGGTECQCTGTNISSNFASGFNCDYVYICQATGSRWGLYNNCMANCRSTRIDYKCSISGVQYTSQADCSNACWQRRFQCTNTGQIVTDPALCPPYKCPLTGKSFATQIECNDKCITPVSCNAQSTEYRFDATIEQPGNNNYAQKLRSLAPAARTISSAPYKHKDLILRQCLDRYTQPNIKFTDPATNGFFEISLMDALIFQWSAERGEAWRDPVSFELPTYPAVYKPSYETNAGSTAIPGTPMYWNKDISAAWAEDTSLRLGRYNIQASRLTPFIYYYQCPTGTISPSTTNNCGAIDPFGGIDWTVKGSHCFQYRCSPDATIEGGNNHGNCGMVNDVGWN